MCPVLSSDFTRFSASPELAHLTPLKHSVEETVVLLLSNTRVLISARTQDFAMNTFTYKAFSGLWNFL